MHADVSAVILAGGAGRRLGGVVKSLVEIDGVRIVDRQLAVLRPRVAHVMVSVGREVPAWAAQHDCVLDAVSDGGPLAGIAAALAAATTPWLLVVAGDMPWIDGNVVDCILGSSASASASASALVPRIGGYPEPLLAAYHARARDVIDAAVARGERSPSRVIQRELIVQWIEEAALREVDPALRSFTSVNSPEDLGR